MFSSSVWHMISIQYMVVVLLLVLVKMLLSFLYSAEGSLVNVLFMTWRQNGNRLTRRQNRALFGATKLCP